MDACGWTALNHSQKGSKTRNKPQVMDTIAMAARTTARRHRSTCATVATSTEVAIAGTRKNRELEWVDPEATNNPTVATRAALFPSWTNSLSGYAAIIARTIAMN